LAGRMVSQNSIKKWLGCRNGINRLSQPDPIRINERTEQESAKSNETQNRQEQ